MKRKEKLTSLKWALFIIAILIAAITLISPTGARDAQPELIRELIDKPELVREYIDQPALMVKYIDKPELRVEYIQKPIYLNLPIWMSYPRIDLKGVPKLKVSYIHHPVWIKYPYLHLEEN